MPSPPVVLALALLALAPITPVRADVYVIDFDNTPPAGQLSTSDIPNSAGRYVIDEAGSLPAELRLKSEETLAENTSAPTYLVIKEGRLPVAADLYGNELLRRWIVSGRHLGALVMTVTEPLPETHVILAGRELDATDIKQLHELGTAALALSSEHSSQAEGAAAVALALVPALATFASAYDGSPPAIAADTPAASPSESPADANGTTSYVPKTSSHWDKVASELDWPLIRAVASIVGGVMLLVLGAIFLPRALREKRFYFPEVEPRSRFSAPFAGGSNAQIKFRP